MLDKPAALDSAGPGVSTFTPTSPAAREPRRRCGRSRSARSVCRFLRRRHRARKGATSSLRRRACEHRRNEPDPARAGCPAASTRPDPGHTAATSGRPGPGGAHASANQGRAGFSGFDPSREPWGEQPAESPVRERQCGAGAHYSPDRAVCPEPVPGQPGTTPVPPPASVGVPMPVPPPGNISQAAGERRERVPAGDHADSGEREDRQTRRIYESLSRNSIARRRMRTPSASTTPGPSVGTTQAQLAGRLEPGGTVAVPLSTEAFRSPPPPQQMLGASDGVRSAPPAAPAQMAGVQYRVGANPEMLYDVAARTLPRDGTAGERSPSSTRRTAEAMQCRRGPCSAYLPTPTCRLRTSN